MPTRSPSRRANAPARPIPVRRASMDSDGPSPTRGISPNVTVKRVSDATWTATPAAAVHAGRDPWLWPPASSARSQRRNAAR